MRTSCFSLDFPGLKIRSFLAGISFLILTMAGQAQNTSPSPLPPPGASKNPLALKELQQAIQSQLQQDFPGARAHYEAARKLDPELKGIDYQLAVVAFNENDLAAAKTMAEKSIASAQEVSACHLLLGVMAGQAKDYPLSVSEFEKAAEANPANPNPYYNLSETYREQGDPKKAIEALRKAMQRNPADPLYPLKLRLARIEAGEDESLDKETSEQLRLPSPAGDWLLTAAAIALKRGFYPEAASLLDQSRQAMQSVLFFAMLQDPVFLKYAKQPEIAIFYDVKISHGGASAAPSSPSPSPR